MQSPLDQETGVNKLFECVSCQGRIQNCFQGGVPIFATFLSVVFLTDLILGDLSTKNDSRGSGRHVSSEKF